MQPDYSKMAQAAPQEQAAPQGQPTEEQLNQIHQEAGLPQGNDAEAIKARILAALESTGFLKKMTKEGLKEFTDSLNEFVKLLMEKNVEAIKKHPITKLLNGLGERAMAAQQGMQQQPMQPQQPMQAAPKNFAGMMKPPGGGMSGR